MQLKVNYYKIKYLLKKKTNFRKKLLPEDNGILPEEDSSGNIPEDVLPEVVCEYFRKTQIILPEEDSSGNFPEKLFPELFRKNLLPEE